MRQLPPYLPTSLVGCSTSGSLGRRWSTGGSWPALTRSASIGASLNCFGVFAGSVMTSGRFVEGAAVDGARVAVTGADVAAPEAGAGAVVGAAAGFGCAGGAAVGAVVGAGWPHAASSAAAPLRYTARMKKRREGMA